MADMMYGTNSTSSNMSHINNTMGSTSGPVGGAGGGGGGELSEDNQADFYSGLNNNNNRQRFPGLYVGNLTWWTTDQDVINNINGIGVNDVQEVKFFENRNNGQSKGFCVVTFNSDASLPIVMEKLPRTELHGQNPVVTPYNRQNLNLFESQTKTRPQINNNSNNNGPPNSHAAGIMGISSISGVHAGTQGLPYSAGGPSAVGTQGGMGGMNNNYNQQGSIGIGPGGMMGSGGVVGGPRGPSNYHPSMWMQMRAPRPMRGSLNPNSMNPNGPMIPGPGVGVHQMNRMRFMQAQQGIWNNSQGGYNPSSQSRLADDRDLGGIRGRLDDRELGRRIDDRDLSRRGTEERSSSASRHRDELRRSDDRSSPPRHREDMRRDDRSSPSSSRHREEHSRRSDRGEDKSSRRERDRDRDRDREKDKEREKESSSRRDKGHYRSSMDHRTRSRSRERSRERRERKEASSGGSSSSRRDRFSSYK